MTYVRGQLGDRLGRQLARAYWWWQQPSSGRRAGDRFLWPGCPQCPRCLPAVRTPAAVPDATVDSGRLPRPLPQPTGQPLRGHHPAVRTASPGGRSSARTSDTLAVSVGGGRCPLPQPRVYMDGRRPAAAVSPPCSGGCGPLRGGQRPSGQHPAALPAARGHGRGVRLRGHLLGFRARSARPATATVRTLGRWTPLVDTGSRRRPGAADTRDGGSVVQPLRQRHAGQPAAQPSTAPAVRPGTGPQGAAAASTTMA
jgi:hypothetical protein